jgi:hypothetical protein
MNANYRIKPALMSEYLILLIELHNTFSLFLEARKQQKEQPTADGKKWINEIFSELLKMNSKLLNYTNEFIELSETIEKAAADAQYIKIDQFLSVGYFSQIKHRLNVLKLQKTELLNMFEPTEPDLKELLTEQKQSV